MAKRLVSKTSPVGSNPTAPVYFGLWGSAFEGVR